MFFKRKTELPEEPSQNSQDPVTPLTKLRTQIEEAELPQQIFETVSRELDKLDKTDPSVAEYAVGFNYIELAIALPWNESSLSKIDMDRAQAVLEARHCGLSQVKQRILEFLAAKTLCSKAQKNILVVDDEEIARSNMEYMLSKDGYSCRSAANGIEALRVLAEEEIDLVITDLKMDRMDGLQLLQQINRLAPEIPVIMVTGFATVSSAVEALKKGAAHYLGKPVNLEELRKTVKEVLKKKLFVEMGKGPILCFTGPPGTGKTSVGRAIAEALGRQFVRISLAGLRDEAELRGHRRTYVGALPGRIITELKRVGVNNPVFMLDEIDKIGQDFRGDPASVLLEVLDPEQNVRFTDHYLDMPFDLSRVMFIATANDISKLPGPLLDRMERIEFAGYTEKEKQQIAKQFILPRQLRAAGLPRAMLNFTPEAISRVISDYTRESGLRNLERELADICRKIALLCLKSDTQGQPMDIDADTVGRLLGPRKFHREAADGQAHVGIATGLVWAESGGEIISVETASMRGSGKLMLTGSLGEVLQESAHAVLSYIRSRTKEYRILDTFFQDTDIHIHFPSGAISKDGPSAGITIFAALLSLLTKRPARRDVALSGEMTLSGRILPIGGIREKILAAKRAGVQCVLLPLANKEEIQALEPDVTENLELILVANADEVVDRVLEARAYILTQ
ncbi:MAG: endopeptidase La [Proteobacteria bacterium]|nr:endopeptidase La [Pseudomonadota bacterium]